MIYKTVIVENTFEAGVAVGSLRAFLAGQGAGELNIIATGEPGVVVEIAAYNPAVMSYAEDRLADFV
jgi:hypothetical protein